MNLENLKSNYEKLLSHLEASGYPDTFVTGARQMIEIIMAETERRGWSSYYDVLKHFVARPSSFDGIVNAGSIISAIIEFDLNGRYPGRTPFGFKPRLATLEDENTRDLPKKWKGSQASLSAFCGLKPLKAT